MLVLAALIRLGDDAYGVRVRREIEDRTGRSVSIGAVYTTLDRLERKGLVRSRPGAPTPTRGGRRKRMFEVQPRGSRALEDSVWQLSRMVEGLISEGGLA